MADKNKKPGIAGKPAPPKFFSEAELKALHLRPGSVLVLTAPAQNEAEMETYTEVAKVIGDEIFQGTGLHCPIIVTDPDMKLSEVPLQVLKEILLHSIEEQEKARKEGYGAQPGDEGSKKPPLIIPGRGM